MRDKIYQAGYDVDVDTSDRMIQEKVKSLILPLTLIICSGVVFITRHFKILINEELFNRKKQMAKMIKLLYYHVFEYATPFGKGIFSVRNGMCGCSVNEY